MPHAYTVWPPADEIARLVSEAQGGPPGALDALLGALRPALVSFFARRLYDDPAEDLAQAALVRITRALPTIAPHRADRFILTIAFNLLRTAFARRARDERRWVSEESAEEVADVSVAERHTGYEELAHAVHRVSKSALTPQQREIVLGLLADESPAEIADRLGISPITVRTRLMRARAILRRELQPYLDTPDPEDDRQHGTG